MEELFKGKDDVIRGIKLRTPRSHMDRPIQYLYPLELHWDMEKLTSKSKNTSYKKLKVDAKEYTPQGTVAAIVDIRIRDIIAEKSDEWLISVSVFNIRYMNMGRVLKPPDEEEFQKA